MKPNEIGVSQRFHVEARIRMKSRDISGSARSPHTNNPSNRCCSSPSENSEHDLGLANSSANAAILATAVYGYFKHQNLSLQSSKPQERILMRISTSASVVHHAIDLSWSPNFLLRYWLLLN